jgi:hypothetical protein
MKRTREKGNETGGEGIWYVLAWSGEETETRSERMLEQRNRMDDE